jgi:hypothetical protein
MLQCLSHSPRIPPGAGPDLFENGLFIFELLIGAFLLSIICFKWPQTRSKRLVWPGCFDHVRRAIMNAGLQCRLLLYNYHV